MKWSFTTAAALALLISGVSFVQANEIGGPFYVSDPVVPILTPALRDLPQYVEDPNLYGLEAKRRDDHGILVPDIDMPPHDNPLAELQLSRAPGPGSSAFETPIVNFQGVTSGSSPPDDTGDVGPNHFLQGDNGSGGSRLTIYNKTGTQLGQWLMETLGSSPCSSGYCDPIVQYDELADRWMISEFDSSANVLCVYVSRTSDPLGQWWAYSFDKSAQGGMQDYPKYGVWPDGYYVGVNNGGYVHVLQRPAMLTGSPATSQSFLIPTLSGFGFQLTLPGTLEGVAPPTGAPAILARPVDTEIHTGYSCSPTPCDVMDLWAFHVDWATPASSAVTHLPAVRMAEFDHTLCGTGTTWDCMPQPGTTQKIDPIREPIHFPLQYRNWGNYETLVGAFVEDVDGTDHAAVHWFELRKVSGTWSMYQEGVLGGEAGIHRSVASAAMDGSGNIAVGYTRTGTAAPYYPSIYYSGRLSTDPLGTMPYYDNMIFNATTSKTNNERWGDYAGIGMDPTDDCTFWFTTEYGGTGQTRVASFKFDQCGCLAAPGRPTASASADQPDEIDILWNDSDLASVTGYRIYRSETSGGPYALIATVADTSPGVANGSPYTYADTPLAAGKTYYYVVDATDGVACISELSAEVSATLYGTNIVYLSHASFTEITGNGDGFLNQGEKWSVQVTLRNTGNLNATSVSAALAGAGFTTCSTCAYGSIAQGGVETKSCTFEFVVDAAFSTVNGCPADLGFGVGSKTCTEQTPAGLDEAEAFSATVASGGLTTANEAGATGIINRKTTTNFATQTSPVVSTPGILTACTVDVALTPPTAMSDNLTVRVEHDPGNDGTYEFTQNVYSGPRSGWTNVTGFNLSTMVNGTAVGNGRWRLAVVHSGSGAGSNGTLTSWTLHLTSGSWTCTYTGAGSCGATLPLRVPHSVTPSRITSADGGVNGTVTWDVTNCASTDYHILLGMGAGLSTYTTAGGRCDIGTSGTYSWMAMPDTSGDFLWFLIVGDDGGTTEGSWGFDSTPAERNGTSASTRCGCTAKDTSTPCGTP